MREVAISVKNLDFSYGETEKGILSSLNLEIYKGEFVALLGHNGCGKSTLAKLLNGYLEPNSGEISVGGVLTTDEERIFDIRKKVGMVFQNPDNQMVASIIEDDIAFGCENLGIEPSEIRKRVDWALDVVNMSEYKDKTPFKLSGGQKQRVAIASILAMMPEILILDESTSMLDPQGRSEVLNTIKMLNKKHNITVILITHYMDEVVDCDRVMVMNEGEILCEGTPREVFSQHQVIKQAKLDLPIPSKVVVALNEIGVDIEQCLTDEELVEGLCRLL